MDGTAASFLGKLEQCAGNICIPPPGDGEAGRKIDPVVQAIAAAEQVGLDFRVEIGIVGGEFVEERTGIYRIVQESIGFVVDREEEVGQTYVAKDVGRSVAGHRDRNVVGVWGESRVEFAPQKRILEEVAAAQRLGGDEH